MAAPTLAAECIAPANPGGGLVVNERNDDAELIVAASSATATRLAQNAYAGMTYDQVRFLGAIGVDGGGDAVTQAIGGFVQAITGDISEVVGFIKSGDVRCWRC